MADITPEEVAFIHRKIEQVEKTVINVDKKLVDLKARSEERHEITKETLSGIDQKMGEHIGIHLRREESVLAAAQAQAILEQQKVKVLQEAKIEGLQAAVDAPEKAISSRKEKLFYPILVLGSGSLFALIIWAIQQGASK